MPRTALIAPHLQRIKRDEFPKQITLQKARRLRSINLEIAKFRQCANLTLYGVVIDSLKVLPRLASGSLRDSCPQDFRPDSPHGLSCFIGLHEHPHNAHLSET